MLKSAQIRIRYRKLQIVRLPALPNDLSGCLSVFLLSILSYFLIYLIFLRLARLSNCREFKEDPKETEFPLPLCLKSNEVDKICSLAVSFGLAAVEDKVWFQDFMAFSCLSAFRSYYIQH